MRKYLVALLALGAFARSGLRNGGRSAGRADTARVRASDAGSGDGCRVGQNAAEDYASDNARRFLRIGRSFVRVTDANAACLKSPIVDTRFGCVFTLKALVITQRRTAGTTGDTATATAAATAGSSSMASVTINVRASAFVATVASAP